MTWLVFVYLGDPYNKLTLHSREYSYEDAEHACSRLRESFPDAPIFFIREAGRD